MTPLFGPRGVQALDRLARRPRALMAFDFDGTLAPLVDRPEQAGLPPDLHRLLRRVAARWPVAIVSGRSLADLRRLAPAEARHLAGNHGIEHDLEDRPLAWATMLDGARHLLATRAGELLCAGIRVEDKTYSIALHYRLAPHDQALPVLAALTSGLGPEIRVGHGHEVVNLTPAGAPDKGSAIRRIAERLGADAGLYVGDDENDEPMFCSAGPEWVTVRVGSDRPDSAAAYCIDSQSEVGPLLERLLRAAGSAD